MIRYRMDLSNEKKNIATEIALNSESNMRKRKIVTPLLAVLGMVDLFAGGYFWARNKSVAGIVFLIIGILMLVLALKAKSFQRYLLRKSENLLDSSFRTGIIEYIFDDEGIQIISQTGTGKNYWNAFKKYGVMGEYIYITRKDNKMILIDRNDLSEEERNELTRLLSNIDHKSA